MKMDRNLLQEEIIDSFVAELKSRIGDSLREVWLFGSRARGNAAEGADYDILVVSDGQRASAKGAVLEASFSCMERHGALVASILYDSATWEAAKHSPLGMNILREGRIVA